jgi:peptidoglycan hydrolase-like protein with peptidoglycan-binding domain
MVVNRPNTRAARAVAAGVVLSLLAAAVVTVDLTRTDRAGSAPRAVAVRLEAASPPGSEDLIRQQAVQALSRTTDLYSCPTLRQGMADPVNGMNCVYALQVALRDNGYPEQRDTGLFLSQTKGNVLDFQRSHGLPQTGNFGPLTRDALVGPDSSSSSPPADSSPSSPPAQAVPSAAPASYTGHHCSLRRLLCSLYLRRTTTHTYAQYLENHQYSAAVAEAIASRLADAACVRIFKLGFLRVVCGAWVDFNINELVNALQEADAEGACLRVSVGLPAQEGTLRFVGSTADNSSRCTD